MTPKRIITIVVMVGLVTGLVAGLTSAKSDPESKGMGRRERPGKHLRGEGRSRTQKGKFHREAAESHSAPDSVRSGTEIA